MFPKPGLPVKVSAGQFTLRLNGGGPPLLTQSPGMVAASLKYPDWGMPSGLSVSAGAGPIGISTDRQPVGCFPGDPAARTAGPNDENGPDYQISLVALPDVSSEMPVKGCVFFGSSIRAKKIRSLELEWAGPAGEHAVLKLR